MNNCRTFNFDELNQNNTVFTQFSLFENKQQLYILNLHPTSTLAQNCRIYQTVVRIPKVTFTLVISLYMFYQNVVL